MSSLGDSSSCPKRVEGTSPTSDQIQPTPASTEASNASHSTGSLPPHSGITPSNLCGRKNRSDVWNYFTKEKGGDKNSPKAKCKFCNSYILYTHGTSAMHTHLKRCKENPINQESKRQKTISFEPLGAEGDEQSGASGVGSLPAHFKFDQDICQNELIKMFIAAELPFMFVENDAFRKFIGVLQPRFNVPSRSTVARRILIVFEAQKLKLKKFLSGHCRRVCLTTDTWTSCQNLNYMSLTAHFIDNNWKLQKKILNFCQVTGHSGEVMAKSVEMCLTGWELNRVLSLTVDNASSNDVGIAYLRRRLMSWNSVILKGEYIHMRCCAHILNLIVKEGLKEIDTSILRIRAAVKYVRSSPSRFSRFKTCAEQEKIAYKGLVSLDVETRWNSTYTMLEAAVKYQKAFELLDMQDKKFAEELNGEKGKGLPTEEDWDYARSILPFLKMFYDATMRISGTSYITSNRYMKEVFGIGKRIFQYCESNVQSINLMASRMKKKYQKYWGDAHGVNMLLMIAVVLDPRHKLEYVNWFIDYFFDQDKATELRAKLVACLKSLYEQYRGNEECSQNASAELSIDDHEDDDPYCVRLYLQSTGRRSDTRSELDKYLNEECEAYNSSVELDLLNWWKVNSTRFPVLAAIAREVLAIPVSTVASESAFSTGGRVLDPYRSSLTPKMVEALICTQDWLKSIHSWSSSPENFEELEKVEQEIASQMEAPTSGVIPLPLDDD